MKKLLVIDDDEQFRAFMSEALHKRAYEVLTASDGDEGLERIINDSPDLVITDIVMPGKEGVEVIMELRQREISIPIIAMSGGNLGNADSYLKMAKKLGANAVISKPFQLEDLILAIKKLLN